MVGSLSSLQHWAQGLNPWNSMRKNPTPVVPAHAALRDNVTTQQEVPKKEDGDKKLPLLP